MNSAVAAEPTSGVCFRAHSIIDWLTVKSAGIRVRGFARGLVGGFFFAAAEEFFEEEFFDGSLMVPGAESAGSAVVSCGGA
jgi:hypothetical protein